MKRTRAPRLRWVAIASLVVTHGGVFAQAPAPAAPPTASVASDTQRVLITGSQIRRIDAEGALPVQVITAEEIRNSGKVTVTEVLQTLSANGANGLTDSTSFSRFAYGAAGISLRSLGPTATLVLINGRRIAPYSVPDSNRGSTSFVNVDAIPMSAIQRIEVLKDGASAIYGSDAVAGVVNIILRNDYRGTEVEANATSDRSGDFGNQWAGLTIGRGSLDEEGWNWMLSGELYRRNEVMLRDVADRVIDPRHRNNSFYYTGRPYNNSYSAHPNLYEGVSIDPVTGASFRNIRSIVRSANCPADNVWAFTETFDPELRAAPCGYSYWDDAQYTSPQERIALFTKGEWAFSRTLTLFGEASVARLTNQQRDWPVPFGAGRGATPNARDGGVSALPTFLPEGHPNNPFSGQPAGIQYLFADVGKQGIDVTNTATRLLAGARGLWGSFDWETGLLHAVDKSKVQYRNRVSLPVLRDAILSGDYNFENPAAGRITADDLRVEPTDRGESSFTQLDARLSGSLLKLPHGMLDFAGGVEVRRESRNYRPDERLYAGEVHLQVAGRSEGERTVGSGWAEFDLPLLPSLRAQLAARADHYSDYGSSVTPKLALAWKASPQLKLRASASEGFRAPSLVESAKTDFPEFNGVGFDPLRCGDWNVDCDGYPVSGVVRANPDLKPETSRSYTLGLVLEPAPGFSAAVDLWQIDRRNEIGALDFDEVLDNEGSNDPLFAGRVTRLPDDTLSVPGEVIPGRIATVERQFVNRGRRQVRGVDLDLRGRLRYAGLGDLQASAVFTYLDRNRDRSTDDRPWVERTGSLNNPRVRGSITLQWVASAWNAGATVNYLSGFRSTAAGDACQGARYLDACTVPEYVTLDLFAGWDVSRHLRLYGNLRNALNTSMPFTPTEPTGNTYWYSAAGPMLRLGARYAF